MIIGINADEANIENPVGIGQFALNVISCLEKIDQKNEYYLYLTEKPKSFLPKERKGWRYKIIWPKKFSTQFALPLHLMLNLEHLQVFFTPTHYAPRFCPVPSIVSIMDLSYLKYPQYFTKKDLWQLKNWTKYSVKNAKKVIAISESTSKDIIEFYNKKAEDVVICYPGISNKLLITNYPTSPRLREAGELRIKELKQKFDIGGEYIIAIGTLQPRKNYEKLINVFTRLKEVGHKEKLVIVGKKGWLYEPIFKLVQEKHLEKQVIFTDYLPNEDATSLLKGAKIYVLASLYEGFGLPVLEAQSCGVPVVASKVSSIPEVGNNSVLYFNPNDEQDIYEKIENLLQSKTLRQDLITKGINNVKRFSWEDCTRRILKTIEEIV